METRTAEFQPGESARQSISAEAPRARKSRALAMFAAAAVLAAGSGAAGALFEHVYTEPATTVASTLPSNSVSLAPTDSLAKAAAAAAPSIVLITVTTSSSAGAGSGVVIASNGTIITNNHVVAAAADGAAVIKVRFASGRSADADIVGQDAAADIAVIRAQHVSGLQPARLGSATNLHVGDPVLAIGSPLGLSGTVTSGIVSALNRTLTAGGTRDPVLGTQSGQTVIRNVIQTDTAINPGNSGGALVDDTGHVVGITTAIATIGGGYLGQQSGSIGLGFAIPIDTAFRVASQLLQRHSS
jgi:putative serine protease PepD